MGVTLILDLENVHSYDLGQIHQALVDNLVGVEVGHYGGTDRHHLDAATISAIAGSVSATVAAVALAVQAKAARQRGSDTPWRLKDDPLASALGATQTPSQQHERLEAAVRDGCLDVVLLIEEHGARYTLVVTDRNGVVIVRGRLESA